MFFKFDDLHVKMNARLHNKSPISYKCNKLIVKSNPVLRINLSLTKVIKNQGEICGEFLAFRLTRGMTAAEIILYLIILTLYSAINQSHLLLF